jgi:hypothetical protein
MWTQQQPISLSDSSSSLMTSTCCIITILSDSGRIVVLPEKAYIKAATKTAIQLQGIQITIEETLDDADYYFATLHESKTKPILPESPTHTMDPWKMFKNTQFFCKIHSMTMANKLIVQDIKIKGCFTVPQNEKDEQQLQQQEQEQEPQEFPMEQFQLDDFGTASTYMLETTEPATIRKTFYMFLANLLYVLDPIKIVHASNHHRQVDDDDDNTTSSSACDSSRNNKPSPVFGSIGDLIRYFVTTMEDLQQGPSSSTHHDDDEDNHKNTTSSSTSTTPATNKASARKDDPFYIFKRKTRNSIKTIVKTVDGTFKSMWNNFYEMDDTTTETETKQSNGSVETSSPSRDTKAVVATTPETENNPQRDTN